MRSFFLGFKVRIGLLIVLSFIFVGLTFFGYFSFKNSIQTAENSVAKSDQSETSSPKKPFSTTPSETSTENSQSCLTCNTQTTPPTTSTSSSIKILGDATCQSQTQAALSLLQEKTLVHYNVINQYIGVIQCTEADSGMYAWEEPPRYQAGAATRNAGTSWYAGTIAHDACHSKQYHEGIDFTGRTAEAQCLAVQADALQKMGASQSTLDYVQNIINSEYWNVDYGSRWW